MPAIKITLNVNMAVDRYIRYDEGEDPKEIVKYLIDDSDEDEYCEFIDKLVVDDFKAIPGCWDVVADITSRHNDVFYNATDCPTDRPIPHWNEFMSLEQVRRFEAEKLRRQLYEALEDATYNNEFDRVIELATQLKKLTDNE